MARIEYVTGNLYRFLPFIDMRTPAKQWFDKGVCAESEGRWKEALRLHRQALRSDPSFPSPLINIGAILFFRKKFPVAEKYFQRAVKIDPRSALARFDLGSTLDETGKKHEALLSYSEAIKIIPAYADAHYNAALLCLELKKDSQAITHFQAYLRHTEDVEDAWRKRAKQEIRRLLSLKGLQLVEKSVASAS